MYFAATTNVSTLNSIISPKRLSLLTAVTVPIIVASFFCPHAAQLNNKSNIRLSFFIKQEQIYQNILPKEQKGVSFRVLRRFLKGLRSRVEALLSLWRCYAPA